MAGKSKSRSQGKVQTKAAKTAKVSKPTSPSRNGIRESDDAAAREALRASDKLYYRIGEVSKLTGVKAHVLRYWETEFRWMAPPKSRSKQRLYRKRDIEFVWLLKRLLWDERYTIAGARQRIQELGVEEALGLLDGPAAEPAPPSPPGAPIVTAEGAADWLSMRAALDEMQVELLSLKGVLQEGI